MCNHLIISNMKKITLLLIILTSTFMFSQQETFEVTFETGTDGSDTSVWSTFENDSNPNIEIVANPNNTGINTSATVAKFTALDAGQPWAGTQTDHKALGEWLLETGNNTLSIMVYKSVVSDVGVKFVNSTNGTIFELKKPNTVTNTWEKLTYDISSFIASGENHNIDRLVIFPDWPADRTSDNIVYFDNVSWSAKRTAAASTGGGSSAAAPTDSPAAPTAAVADVISIFSDSYTDISATWNPGWGQSTVLEDVTIAGNPLKKYSSLNFTGIEPTGGTIDASSMTHINLDYWTSDATEIKFKLVDYNGDGTWGSDNSESEVTKSVTTGSWGTLSIPFTEYSGINFNDIGQLVISATGATNPVYIDNIYFSKEATNGGGSGATAPTDAPTAPTAAVADVISIFSDAYTDLAATWNPGWGQSTVLEDETIANNPVKKYSSFTFTGIEPSAPIDASSMTHINLDYWTSDATEIKFKLVDYNGDGTWGSDNSESEVTKSVTTGSWGTLSIPFTEYSGINFNDIGQLVISATGATNPVYIDNIYFSNGSALSTSKFTLAKVSLYPNPTTNFINISSEKDIQKANVYNVLGKVVKSLNINQKSKNIDVSNLKSGIYLIKYVVDNKVGTAKFIKQ